MTIFQTPASDPLWIYIYTSVSGLPLHAKGAVCLSSRRGDSRFYSAFLVRQFIDFSISNTVADMRCETSVQK